MTKFEALKQLPVDRFADLFYEMSHKAGSVGEFKGMLTEEFPDDLIPALQMCSTGADLEINGNVIRSDIEGLVRERGERVAKIEALKSLIIDTEKGIYEVNGRDVKESGCAFTAEFENGKWSLMITESTIYTTPGREVSM